MKIIEQGKYHKISDRLLYALGKKPKNHVVSDDGRVHYYNWSCQEMVWFYEFIRDNVQAKKIYNFFSVDGNKMFCNRNNRPNSIFYSAETVHTHKLFLEYRDYCLKTMDLSMTFDWVDAPNYLRFPNWLTYMFAPIVNKDKIAERVAEVNASRNNGKYEAVIISNHDSHKTRGIICDRLNDILSIKYAGKWRNNTHDLWDKYEDNKVNYVREFKFNICPENRNVKDYVTEKIFESFIAGSIPIYYGSKGLPEPGIINPRAFIYWDIRKKNSEIKEWIRELNTNSVAYQEFLEKERLLPYTVDYVYDTFRELKERLEAM